MSRTIETEVFKFDELSDRAKERARDWWRSCENQDNFYAESVIDDAVQCAESIGITIDTRPVRLMGGGTRQDPCVWWSGFWSQGDGACFNGRYAYVIGAAKAIREHAPEDKTLHAIADNLQAIQRRHFYRLEARVKQRGHYQHSGCTTIDVTNSETGNDVDSDTADAIAVELRAFMDWIYRQLRSAYEYTMSDESVDDNIRANEYEFDENGGIQ